MPHPWVGTESPKETALQRQVADRIRDLHRTLTLYIYIYIYMLPPPEGSTILAVSENWIQHLAVSEDSEANEAYMKRVVNECDAC